jgi:opacity protein-like surface antigen
MTPRWLFPCLVLSGFVVSVASAQSGEATVFAGIAQLRNGDVGRFGLGAQEVRLTNGMRVGARLSLNSGSLTGHELSYAFERHDIEIASAQESRARTQQFFYNFALHVSPKGSAVRPFVTAGAGYTSFAPGGGGIFQDAGGENKFGYNFGGGLKFKMSRHFGARFDVRDHVSGKPNFLDLAGVDGRLHAIEYSAGFSLLF